MLKLVDKYINTVFIIIFHMLKNRDIENKDSIEFVEMKTAVSRMNNKYIGWVQ